MSFSSNLRDDERPQKCRGRKPSVLSSFDTPTAKPTGEGRKVANRMIRILRIRE
jgi:hypothetical protein